MSVFSEAAAERFTIGLMDGPFRVGQTFSIPVEFHDEYGNLTKPNKDIKPELSARYSYTFMLTLYKDLYPTAPAGHVQTCYRPQTKLREGNAFTPVCQSFCPQGVHHWSLDQLIPVRRQTLLARRQPPLPPAYGQQMRGTHPTGMHLCSFCRLYCWKAGGWYWTEMFSCTILIPLLQALKRFVLPL